MRKGLRFLTPAALLPILAGCFEIGPLFGPDAFTPSDGCWFCIPYDLMMETGTPTILKGDTVHVRVLSTMGHDRGTFSVNGTALRLRNGADLALDVTTPATEATAVAVSAGRDTVKSQAADTAATARLAIRVVDSSAVTAIQAGIEPNAKMRVGDVRQVMVFLWVGQEMVYGGVTSMSVGNSDVLLAEPAQVDPKLIFLRAKAVGTTTLTLRFLQRSQSYQIEVIP